MNGKLAWLRSTTVVGVCVAVVVVFEVVVLASDVPDAVRFVCAGVGAVALALGVAQLGANSRGGRTER
jgi:hypothetical protein